MPTRMMTATVGNPAIAVLDSLTEVTEAHVKKNAVGEFVLPSLLKISTVRRPAHREALLRRKTD